MKILHSPINFRIFGVSSVNLKIFMTKNKSSIATPKKFRIKLPALFNREHTGQQNHITLVFRIIPCIAHIFLVGNDWTKVWAILNVALHSAIWIPVNFLRLRIIVAHFAQTVSAHVIMIARNRTKTKQSYVF